MTDYAGDYSTDLPIVSYNQAAIIKHKAKFYSGSGSISIPLVKGTRFIILSVLAAGATCSIGFGQAAGTITDSRFTFTQGSGPLDLSTFLDSAPFTQYREPDANFLYLIITGTGVVTAAVSAIKA